MSKSFMIRRILVVEDDLFTSRVLSKKIKQYFGDYTVHQSFDIGSAIQQCSTHTFDLLILDLKLPSGSSLNEYRKLNKLQGCPIIIYTNSEDERDELKSLDLGASDFILKSRGIAVLLRRIVRYIDITLTSPSVNDWANESVEGFSLDLRSHMLCDELNGDSCELTKSEAIVLRYMLSNHGEVVLRDEITQALEGVEYNGWSRKLDLYVSRIRRKTAAIFAGRMTISTVRGKGYILKSKK